MIELLAKSGVFIHLDPRREGVSIPPQFRKQPELVLQVGLNMAVPIRDLEVEDDGVSCTLSFNRSPFWCRMPWSSIFAIVSDEDRRGVVWPEDVPPESKLSSAPAPAPKRPMLRAVGRDEVAPPPPSEPSPERGGAAIAGEGTCGACGTKWVEDQDACPICGASRAEGFRPAPGSEPADAEAGPGSSPDGTSDEDEAAARAPGGLPLSIAAMPAAVELPPALDVPPVAPAAALPPLEPPKQPSEPPAAEAGDKPKRALPPYLRVVK